MSLAPLALSLLQTLAPATDLEWRATFEAPDAQPGDQFGRAVAVGGTRAVVAAWRREGNLGGAHVYRWDDDQLVLEGTLEPSDGFGGSMCGTSAHVNDRGDLVVLSALGDDQAGAGAGAAYVFRRGARGAWREEAKLTAYDALAHDGFGSAVAVGDDLLVVGAKGVDAPPFYYNSGALYPFRHVDGAWKPEPRILLPDLDIGDACGARLALDGRRLAVGVPSKDNEFGDDAGAVYVYEHYGARWNLAERVVHGGLAPGDAFGLSVALDGPRLLVGSTDDQGAGMVGVVHAFERVGAAWIERTAFGAPSPQAFDFFGETVALHGDRALVSSRVGSGPFTCEVHAYDLDPLGAAWTQTLVLPVGSPVSFANPSVGLGGCFALVGEALHGANLGQVPSHVDVFALGCEDLRPSGALAPTGRP